MPRPVILIAAAAALVLWALSRTARGQELAADAVGGVMNALSPRGIRNNNPGNIRWIASVGARWRGMVRNDGDNYGVFDTAENGIRAIGKQLRVYESRGLNTIRKIISTWAPASENNTAAYVAQMSKALGIGADVPFPVSARLTALTLAIIKHENGVQPYAPEFVNQWANAA